MKGKVSLWKDKAFVSAIVLCFVAAAVLIGANYYDTQQKKNENYVDLNHVSTGENQLADAQTPEQEIEDTKEADEHFGMDNVMDATDEVKELEMEAADSKAIVNDKTDFTQEAATTPGDATTTSAKVVNQTEGSALHFSEDTRIEWPLEGTVLKPYHMDSMLYFETLDQYKYNPAMLIGGKEGDTIVAAAAGKVVEVHETDETGLTVEMDMGDGYRAIYGQLSDVVVSNGQVVEEGGTIGTLAEPSRYYSMEGTHLYFEICKDGSPVNPEEYLR